VEAHTARGIGSGRVALEPPAVGKRPATTIPLGSPPGHGGRGVTYRSISSATSEPSPRSAISRRSAASWRCSRAVASRSSTRPIPPHRSGSRSPRWPNGSACWRSRARSSWSPHS